ncbi:BatA domain-containing protein [Flagellimonas nanhaiensis]|uniref:Aerotolerance regulator N-terminal domain-containing protein n=1 Tax=Flagellimonas nanhaiensis TaxID=2292706 RepID=A0A371JV52_9FLAO|nr:BatA domain-containing protein [Allomuricauda nanhaiensis]RDY61689.1 hypothetical protein DX873_05925 [Allomuricauda nanhaiensis]
MQFKHPEILWALFLLLIPIFIHLFQLRRYKKTPFTNVAMLQKVVSESRKSNTLKKWLLLLTRCLLISALILAFAQPFSASETALKTKEVVIYLDDSFSMQAKNNGLTLLEKSVQDLFKDLDPETPISLFTNEKTYKNVTLKSIQNNLLSLSFSPKQLDLGEIQLKANTLFSTSNAVSKNLVLISDFQQRIASIGDSFDSDITQNLVPTRPNSTKNVSIDSVVFQNGLTEQATITALLSGGSAEENIPISLFNGDMLIAKTAANFSANGKASVEFSVPSGEEIHGLLEISDNGLAYDNRFFFNINEKEKVKVLAINESDDNYLERLFTDDEFILSSYVLRNLDYSTLDQQKVVVLNNLRSIPASLQKVLKTFRDDGGTLVVVPSTNIDLDSYNQFFRNFGSTQWVENANAPQRITSISFQHPLFRNVFEKEVTNFQYPTVNQYYKIRSTAPKILSFEGNDAFLYGQDGLYFFSASMEIENSNFKNSPLIVPTLYNMAMSGLKASDIYHVLGKANIVDLSIGLDQDQIINVSKDDYQFIPLQQVFSNKVRLTFDGTPTEGGVFTIDHGDRTLQKISFNYPRSESKLNYLNIEQLENVETYDSIASLFEYFEAENNIATYWKWFVILALFLALIEVIIQKFIT